MAKAAKPQATFDGPATYRIKVRGELAASQRELIHDMSIRCKAPRHRPAITTLEGRLTDQAALAGVLNTLYELHLPVLSVKLVQVEAAEPSALNLDT